MCFPGDQIATHVSTLLASICPSGCFLENMITAKRGKVEPNGFANRVWKIYVHLTVCKTYHARPGSFHGPLTRYVKLRVAHAPRLPETFSPPPSVSDPGMHHGTCVTHVSWCMPGSLTSSFIWNRWWGKCSRHSRRIRHAQFYVSGKRFMKNEPISP